MAKRTRDSGLWLFAGVGILCGLAVWIWSLTR
jgi:hypothetical protein